MPVMPSHAQTGITAEGHPWIGAEQPELEIIEFADYQCFQCKKMHHYLRELVGRYPEKIRLVHRSFPMDHEVNFIVPEPFHVGSAKLSLVSIYAAAVGKFWEMNDLLYRISKTGGAINLREIAEATGMDVRQLAAATKDPVLKKRLEIDIRHGLKLGILGTPSYVINGQVYQGFVPHESISAVINAERS
jgi:protein-disulfide isomerase